MNKLFSFLGAALMLSPAGSFASLQSAKVTTVVNDVRLALPQAAARRAKEGDLVRGQTVVQTGRRSRSELRFQDDTITRLGSNSIFRFDQGTRDLTLQQGTILLTAPKGAGGAQIRTATVTAAVTGTTILMEYFFGKWVKIIVLEGTLTTWIEKNGRQSRQKPLKAGQMVVLKSTDAKMPNPSEVDVQRILQTAGLLDQETFGPLPPNALRLIGNTVNNQAALKNEGFLVPATHGTVSAGTQNPAGGGSIPGEQSSDTRDLVVNSTPKNIEREGDDPGGPPPGRDPPPTEGDDPLR